MDVKSSSQNANQKQQRWERKTIKKKQWTREEKASVKKHLERFLVMGQLPGKRDCEKCIAEEKALKDRTWKNVKDFCRNQITAMKTAK